ncbi:N-acetyltransferase [Methylobacterium sp. J-072]|uniref:GNAT family N-acetyltransferase n=1 Tax=Methylobacterium sp. J-072 TaxID=2836651 RepID=UPI001FB91AC6|nr:GNAT family N-acetyltransferase [Methylobacterium sp. J-072]MCJ2091104.1 N-acetyltransferase [Methylobacterium sp. J-072]
MIGMTKLVPKPAIGVSSLTISIACNFGPITVALRWSDRPDTDDSYGVSIRLEVVKRAPMDVRQGKNMTDLVRNNVDQSRFELGAGDAVVFADYQRESGCLIISYVYAPPALRGTGAAGQLMEGVVAHAQASGDRIVPLCGYARTWLHRHRAHRDLIA